MPRLTQGTVKTQGASDTQRSCCRRWDLSQGILPLPLSLLSVRDVLCVRGISSSRELGFTTDSTSDFIPPSSEFEQQHLLQIWSAQQTSIPALLPSSGPDLASHSSTFSSTAVFKSSEILKKYDKRTEALIRQPFIEKVLQ
ncbi:hypothetical protein ZIOFF_009337 [Zingiber officinale]|uniref:Uncharacterized protein n=1 Tax=Zingiber officinale TaxID=94328 RepID=A0A8J5HXB5_ZINOF|nr:hypothetical protein ZIOFF_009337 [Zingiber officinale]